MCDVCGAVFFEFEIRGVVACRTLEREGCPVLAVPFQNIRIPKHSAYTRSLPDGTAAKFAFG